MAIIDEKVLAATVIAVLYVLTWLFNTRTIVRVIINTVFGIAAIIWVLDFLGLYPVSKIIQTNFYS